MQKRIKTITLFGFTLFLVVTPNTSFSFSKSSPITHVVFMYGDDYLKHKALKAYKGYCEKGAEESIRTDSYQCASTPDIYSYNSYPCFYSKAGAVCVQDPWMKSYILILTKLKGKPDKKIVTGGRPMWLKLVTGQQCQWFEGTPNPNGKYWEALDCDDGSYVYESDNSRSSINRSKKLWTTKWSRDTSSKVKDVGIAEIFY